ncbi:hypothetical protein Tco_0004993 [Tanacetum coccineum]
MALPPRDQRYQYLRYEGIQYTDTDIVDFETRLARIYRREVHRVEVFNFRGLPDLMAEGLSTRMLMEHKDAQGVWRGLHTTKEMETVGFGAYWAKSVRQIPNKGDLRDYWIRISPARDFLGTAPSYTSIRDPILRLCHRLIACSIAGRSQAPEKVIVTDLFYLRGMDVGSFVARLVEHFGLLTKERIRGLTVIAPALPVIDMAELVRLQIYVEIDDTWAWVALGPERQSDATTGAPGAAEDAPAVDKGDQAVLATVQAPPPSPAAARTIPQRMAILEEDVHEIRGGIS